MFLRVDAAFLAAHPGVSGETTKLWESGDMFFRMLDTGEYQLMVGPDADGDTYVNTFDAMPPPTATNISYNMYGNSPKW